MFNFISNQENLCQYHNEIPLHATQMAKTKNIENSKWSQGYE